MYLHQIWYDLGKGSDVPDKFKPFAQSWNNHHPEMKYILWNKEMGDSFMKEYYPQYYDQYDKVRYPIMKVDILRYCLLQTYGGIYADIDYQCLANFSEFLNDFVYINEEAPTIRTEILKFFSGKPIVSNSLLISPQGHPFWEKVLKEMFLRIEKYKSLTDFQYILKTTGPTLLQNLITDDIKILPQNQFNPCNDCRCFSHNQKIYSIHSYSSLWLADRWRILQKMMSCFTIKEVILSIVLILILIYMIIKWI